MLSLQARLAEAYSSDTTSARTQVDRYAGARAGSSTVRNRRSRLIRAGYEVEEFGVLDLLSAQRSYFEARLAYLDSLRMLWDAVLEIQGLLLEDSLADRPVASAAANRTGTAIPRAGCLSCRAAVTIAAYPKSTLAAM